MVFFVKAVALVGKLFVSIDSELNYLIVWVHENVLESISYLYSGFLVVELGILLTRQCN
jgi:hypothetical protein